MEDTNSRELGEGVKKRGVDSRHISTRYHSPCEIADADPVICD